MSSLLSNAVDAAVGGRVQLDEYECSQEFSDLLPCEGVLRTRMEARGGARDWMVLELAETLEYQGRPIRKVLVRSRRTGVRLGGPGENSAYILVPRNESALAGTSFDVAEFENVGYGVVIGREPAVEAEPAARNRVHRTHCRQCGEVRRETDRFCPECGAWRRNPLSAEVTLFLKILLLLAFVTVLLWAVLSVDPAYGRRVVQSSLWLKALLGMGGLAVALVVFDVVVRKVWRR